MTPARISGCPCSRRTRQAPAPTGPRGWRRHPDGPVHRVHRQFGGEVAVPGGEAAAALVTVELPDPHDLGQRILQRGGEMGGGQRAEQRHGGRRGPVPARLDRHEVHGDRVTGSAPSMWNGPVCGFRNGNSQTCGTRSSLPRPPGEAVLRPQFQHRSRADPRDRGGAPNVHTNCSVSGRNDKTCGSLIPQPPGAPLLHMPTVA